MTAKSERHHSLRWVLVPEAGRASPGTAIPIDADKMKHLRRVLRMEWEEQVRLTDGAGRLFRARLIQRGDSPAFVLEELLTTESLARTVELVIGLPKNATMDWIVEKAVECGVTAITPVVTSRSVVKPDGDTSKYVRRWQSIIDAAVEQSEQLFRPLIAHPVGFRDWAALAGKQNAASFSFVSELREQDVPEADLVRDLWHKLSQARADARLFIGPEGGMSADERDALRTVGFEEVSLGKTVLRVETAVISALMLLRVSHLSQ